MINRRSCGFEAQLGSSSEFLGDETYRDPADVAEKDHGAVELVRWRQGRFTACSDQRHSRAFLDLSPPT